MHALQIEWCGNLETYNFYVLTLLAASPLQNFSGFWTITPSNLVRFKKLGQIFHPCAKIFDFC